MIFIKGGTFEMGSKKSVWNVLTKNEAPIHSVTVNDFYIGKYEITQAQWKEIMGNNPSKNKGENNPVEKISWNEIQEYLRKLNKTTGNKFRLPTEAEWEYAARGGIEGANGPSYKYAGSNNIGEVAWLAGNSNLTTHPVGKKKPNELGLYDMSGNV